MNWNELRGTARRIVNQARPITNAVERVASLAVHLRGGITPMGAVGLVSAAANSLGGALEAPCSPSSSLMCPCSLGTMVAALKVKGWCEKDAEKDGRFVRMGHGEATLVVHRDGDVLVDDPSSLLALEAALDAFLPRALRLSHTGDVWVDAPADMRHYTTEIGAEIARLIRAHADDGPRCVLLKGKPGTGKTTLAREIADRLDLGRVVFLDPSAFGRRSNSNSLAMLRARVIVVDDIDKIEAFDCEAAETMRAVAPVVLLTANNGDRDDVIDGALGRPGRIDEVFAIEAEPFPREAPFNLLTDAEWADAQTWPVASVNELRRRLERRGREGMRFDDLRERIGRRVRSREVLA